MAKKPIEVETINHREARRRNIPTAEFESLMRPADKSPIRTAYARRNRDLDPQLVWRGKDEQDWSDLIVQAPPLYIQEKLHPKIIIDDLRRQAQARMAPQPGETPDLFADFNGLPDIEARTEFYQHDQHWSNRMITGDSLAVMASLAEREGLRGRVQCIYFDPPYGIKFNSNFQWSTTSRDVKDGARDQITREPEQVRAFRDTWRDGIHSYLTYLRDRLTVARDLLTESGSIFVQIGDENVHRVRALMDEVFGEQNDISEIVFVKTSGLGSNFLSNRGDYLLWYARSKDRVKFRQPYLPKNADEGSASTYTWLRNLAGDFRGMSRIERKTGKIPEGFEIYKPDNITSQGNPFVDFEFDSQFYRFRSKTPLSGLKMLGRAGRIHKAKNSLQYVRKLEDFAVVQVSNLWSDTGTGSFTDDKVYVVQTGTKTTQRCILMTTDPGDLVLDPTCGSGTTAYVAEQWGRRWITIDTSRVAIALARSRLMGARYSYYLLADSPEGQRREAEVTRSVPSTAPTQGDIRFGFVYERVPHITLKSIANNAEIDVIWEKWQQILEPLRAQLNTRLRKDDPQITQISQIKQGDANILAREGAKLPESSLPDPNLRKSAKSADKSLDSQINLSADKPWEEWEIPREADPKWLEAAKDAHQQ
jgi:adenine-specific DNA-methyltransferase